MSKRISTPCPICKKPSYMGDEDFPFCSERCRLIDLGKWASEEYRIPAPLSESEIEKLLQSTEESSEDRPPDE